MIEQTLRENPGKPFLSSPLRLKTLAVSSCQTAACDERFAFVPVTGTNTGTNRTDCGALAWDFSPLAMALIVLLATIGMITISRYCPVPL
jgi:hypothetical protein